jgi:hypothetical protein
LGVPIDPAVCKPWAFWGAAGIEHVAVRKSHRQQQQKTHDLLQPITINQCKKGEGEREGGNKANDDRARAHLYLSATGRLLCGLVGRADQKSKGIRRKKSKKTRSAFIVVAIETRALCPHCI